MEALRRKTLQWEKINPKGNLINHIYAYNDGKMIDYNTTLAIRGEIKFKGLGYCSECNRIMTRNEYEAHLHPTAGKECLNCNYHVHDNFRISKDRNGMINVKAKLLCGYHCNENYREVNVETPCLYRKCNGEFMEITEDILKLNAKPIIPKKILTIKAFEDWSIVTIRHDSHIELCDPSGCIDVRVDKNGYVTKFIYDGVYCYYDDELDDFVAFSTGLTLNAREKHKKIMRRMFK